MSKVSVIIPTYNRSQSVLLALDSVAQQTYSPQEIIVVDDGSTDGTDQAVHNWHMASRLRLRYEWQPNQGVSSARNRGVEIASGDWISFLDSDDQWEPTKLARQMPLCDSFRWSHTNEKWIRRGVRVNEGKRHFKAGGRILDRAIELCCVSPSSVLIERRFFEGLGGFSTEYPVCEDYALWLKMAAREEIGYIEDRLVIKYGGHADQLSSSRPAMDYFRVKALWELIDSTKQDSTVKIAKFEVRKALQSIVDRCRILLKGYQKHQNLENYRKVEDWLAKAERRLSTENRATTLPDAEKSKPRWS